MKKSINLLSILLGSLIILTLVGYISEEPHDHKTYQYEHPSSVNLYTTFTVCGDTSLVTKDTGTHLDFIPKKFKEQM